MRSSPFERDEPGFIIEYWPALRLQISPVRRAERHPDRFHRRREIDKHADNPPLWCIPAQQFHIRSQLHRHRRGRVAGKIDRPRSTHRQFAADAISKTGEPVAATAGPAVAGRSLWSMINSGALLKPCQASSEEVRAPFTNNLARCVQARGDLIVVEPLGSWAVAGSNSAVNALQLSARLHSSIIRREERHRIATERARERKLVRVDCLGDHCSAIVASGTRVRPSAPSGG
jgi:hypothetical protein